LTASEFAICFALRIAFSTAGQMCDEEKETKGLIHHLRNLFPYILGAPKDILVDFLHMDLVIEVPK